MKLLFFALVVLATETSAALYFIHVLADRVNEMDAEITALKLQASALTGQVRDLNDNDKRAALTDVKIQNSVGRLGTRIKKLERKDKNELTGN